MNKRRRLSLVQISRAIAILFVLLGHANIVFYSGIGYDWFQMGQWERTGGVDFFFIVTGFMIFYLYHNKAGVKGASIDFIKKRAIRIYPLYWIFTLLALAAVYVIPSIGEPYSMDVILKSIFTLPTEPVLSSAWSLSHIVFFYFLFSTYLFKPNLFKPIIMLWIVITALVETKLIVNIDTFLFSFSSLEILFGSFVAYLSLKRNFKYSTLFIIVGFIGYLSVWLNNIYHIADIHTPTFYCLSAMMIMLGIAEKDKVERRVPKFLSYLGDASYSIYIAHGPFLQLYFLFMQKYQLTSSVHPFILMVSILALTTISSCMVYSIIERPLNQYLRTKLLTKKTEEIKIPQVIAFSGTRYRK
ncbi:acyltransferase [Halobacillus andaensis]|uniref:Acyltransferase n=1 Tax=Halobacillus andaensis TaxID=1176239 RepID=A0A917EWB5_HALAA|nr:acyltransferase [Halobacillus andaensis]MBP2005814.1 peptidoglycan/LPS O-acetylase OafA/YrhL [Halobacillus andaensis]GGF25856.1 acyltransferase [Halobacillus andaensis]